MAHVNPTEQSSIIFENVSVVLDHVVILDRVNAHVPKGGCTIIIGPNGAGKTTLLLALLGQVPYKGKIVRGFSTGKTPLRLGYVPQRLSFDRELPTTVMEFMLMGIQRRPLWLGQSSRLKPRARELLNEVKADALHDRRLGALSGGEMQRVLLALALQQNPDLLILDEPAAGVDYRGEQLFCELLDSLRKSLGFTQLMVSHDLAMATHHATHTICLNHQVVAEGPPRATLTSENLTAMFGLHMGLVDAAAMPEEQTSCHAACCKDGKHD
jgi:zinc transport system ATP-binding protein